MQHRSSARARPCAAHPAGWRRVGVAIGSCVAVIVAAGVAEFGARVARTDRGTMATEANGSNAVRSRGTFFVVDVKVTNNGETPAILIYPRQELHAYGTTFFADQIATSYLNTS